MRKFDTRIQYFRYKVLRETAKLAWEDQLLDGLLDIPKTLVPGPKPTMRCCIFKERAIVSEQVKLAMGGNPAIDNIIEVIEIACAECPVGGYKVGPNCMGCMAHRCADACKFGAITIDEHQKAHIDKSKCKECGACARVCPYSAISDSKRPCQQACKVGAISMNEEEAAMIDNSKCTACGSCVYQCPFGAINEKSFILDVIKAIKEKDENHKVYAAVAPSIAGQFIYAKRGQVLSGLKALGFDEVVEVALGADMTTYEETLELKERAVMTSSCCPAFVAYIAKQFPDLLPYVSSTLSPMAMIGKHIKNYDENATVVFIGPCTAKKMEMKREEVAPYVDSVLTFEELQALFDSKDIDICQLEEMELDSSSYFGRIFARSGGLSEAVRQGINEHGMADEVEYKPVICNGIEECKTALLKLRRDMLEGNFLEGMACVGGCVNGNGCLTHMAKSRMDVENYGKAATTQSIFTAVENANNHDSNGKDGE